MSKKDAYLSGVSPNDASLDTRYFFAFLPVYGYNCNKACLTADRKAYMENSLFIARIFGICYLVMGIGLIFNRKNLLQVMDDFCKNAALTFLAGLSALVVGVVIILTHNIWVANWTVMITIIGWGGLIKGIWMIVFPDSVYKFMEGYRKNKNLLIVHSAVALIFGAVLTFFGFFAG